MPGILHLSHLFPVLCNDKWHSFAIVITVNFQLNEQTSTYREHSGIQFMQMENVRQHFIASLPQPRCHFYFLLVYANGNFSSRVFFL